MNLVRKFFLTGFLAIVSVLLHLYSRDAARVEEGYSRVLFPAISAFQRTLFGWLPFSLGDLVYAAVILYAVYRIIKGVRKRRLWNWGRFLQNAANLCLVLYIVFNLFWGLNYNREGVLSALDIPEIKYSKPELIVLNGILAGKVNAAKQGWIREGSIYPGKDVLFSRVKKAFGAASRKYPFLEYNRRSIKPSVWSMAGNYLGFTGYYNPFTGEAQVNTTTPGFLHPFIACHEVAHQVGYAKEMEANFAGFLAAVNSPDPLLQYSAYLDMFFYANRNLYNADSALAENYRSQLIEPVKKDIVELRRFQKKYRSFLGPVFRWVYGKFLEQNEQPQGIMAYDEVTSFIIAFYKKEGVITN